MPPPTIIGFNRSEDIIAARVGILTDSEPDPEPPDEEEEGHLREIVCETVRHLPQVTASSESATFAKAPSSSAE